MKLLIVDDERPIRSGLERGINWSSIGIDQVFSAENGLVALDLCHKHKPELVITDIRMPGISGLELSQQILRMYSPVRIIILSGYSEFSYAQEALKLGVADYLLKPIDEAQLQTKVNLCRQAILRETMQSQLQNDYVRFHQQKKRKLLLREGRVLRNPELTELAGYAGLRTIDRVMVACVSLDNVTEEQRMAALDYLSTALLSLEKKQIVALYHDERSIFLLVPGELYSRSLSILHSWQENINPMLGNQFSTSVSIAVSEAGTLALTGIFCTQAELAIAHRLYMGSACFIRWEEVKSVAGAAEHLRLPREKLTTYADMLRCDLMKEQLAECFSMFRKMPITAAEPLTMFCLELKSLILSLFKSKGLSEDILLDSELSGADTLKSYVTVDGYEQWACTFCEKTIGAVQALTGKICSREIMRATEYIQKHYHEDISLSYVAEYVGKSKNYFSTLFKQEIGISFVEYINNIRIQEACRLLLTTDRLNYEIAADVGFCNYKYFSSVFRKQMHCSPDQYRRECHLHK